MTPLLDRKLVFVTGKGGTGKTTVASALALLVASRGKKVLICEMDGKGELSGYYEVPPTAFKEKEVQPGLFAMTMDTEASLREYLKLQLHVPVIGRIGPVAKAFDFLATAAPGGQGDHHGRQDLLGGPRWQLGHGRGGRPGHRPHRRTAGRPPGRQRARPGRTHPDADGLDARHVVRPLDHRTPRRLHARGDAGHRDDRAGRADPRGDDGGAGRCGREPGAARALRSPGRAGLRRPDRPRGVDRARRPGRGRRRPRPGRGPAGRHDAPHPLDPPRAPPAGHRTRRATALPPLPVHQVPRPAHHPPGGRVTG